MVSRGARDEDLQTFFDEASCRIGLDHNLEKILLSCRPYVSDHIPMTTLDVSGYQNDEIGHGFHEFSPFVSSDLNCELAPIAPDTGLRALNRESYGNFPRKTYWYVDRDVETSILDCTSGTVEVKTGYTFGEIEMPLVEPIDQPESSVISSVRGKYWRFRRSDQWVTEQDPLNSLPLSEISAALSEDQLCSYNRLTPVGLASREGDQDRNEILADARAESLRDTLVSAIAMCPDDQRPEIGSISIGQACPSGQCRGSVDGLEGVEPGSFRDRPIIIVGSIYSVSASPDKIESSILNEIQIRVSLEEDLVFSLQ